MEGYPDSPLIPQLLLNLTERDYRQKQELISWDLHQVLRLKVSGHEVGRKGMFSFLE